MKLNIFKRTEEGMDGESGNILSPQDCASLLEDLRVELSWEWDSRFNTALALIRTGEGGPVAAQLMSLFGEAWQKSTIKKAPEGVQRLLVRLGGIMPDQLLYAGFVAEEPGDTLLFCAWWPWGNGQTISLRIGTSPSESSVLGTLVPLSVR